MNLEKKEIEKDGEVEKRNDFRNALSDLFSENFLLNTQNPREDFSNILVYFEKNLLVD